MYIHTRRRTYLWWLRPSRFMALLRLIYINISRTQKWRRVLENINSRKFIRFCRYKCICNDNVCQIWKDARNIYLRRWIIFNPCIRRLAMWPFCLTYLLKHRNWLLAYIFNIWFIKLRTKHCIEMDIRRSRLCICME
jgi:hypothetical protein